MAGATVMVLLVAAGLLLCTQAAADHEVHDAPGHWLSNHVVKWLHFSRVHHTEDNVSHEPIPLPPAYVAGAGEAQHPSVDYANQMMHKPEIDWMASYLKPTDTYLEWGSGGSSRNFPPMVSRAYSIEHNCEWSEYMNKTLSELDQNYDNLQLMCAEVPVRHKGWGTLSPYEHGDYDTFQVYVDKIDSLGVEFFDIIFVDGRARMGCALKALEYMHEESVLFIHDFYSRNRLYSGVLEYYDEIGRVLAYANGDPEMGPIDMPQGLVALRRKPEAPRKLTPKQIQAKYDVIDWRYPFVEPLTSFYGYWNYYVLLNFDLSKWRAARNPEKLVARTERDMVRLLVLYLFVTTSLGWSWNENFTLLRFIRHKVWGLSKAV